MKRTILLIVALLTVLVSVLYTNHLASRLSDEEQQRVAIWAEATRQFILAEPGADIEFVSTIIEGNTTIPVYMVDADGRYLFSRNAEPPKRLQKAGREAEAQAWYQRQVDQLRQGTEPIEVRLSPEDVQYIYYDESNVLRQLHYLPYVQIILLVAFLLVAFLSLKASRRAEENRVWVGLSKETAHQLGTPISSLNAWIELLKAKYPEEASFAEMESDISRLSTITERFSKIGSKPKLTEMAVRPVVEETVRYMTRRISGRVHLTLLPQEDEEGKAMLNAPLFAWVIENLIKNAVDAMEGQGSITIAIRRLEDQLIIDVTDTGKGIERSKRRRVFTAGYTTKSRGWGLGLSLSHRIIHDYHHGDIFVQASEPGKGSTFRIRLVVE